MKIAHFLLEDIISDYAFLASFMKNSNLSYASSTTHSINKCKTAKFLNTLSFIHQLFIFKKSTANSPLCSKNNKVSSYSKGPTGDTALMQGDTGCTVCKSVLLLNRSLKAKNKQASSTNKVMRKFLLHCRG